jgi:hypothetical protein
MRISLKYRAVSASTLKPSYILSACLRSRDSARF